VNYKSFEASPESKELEQVFPVFSLENNLNLYEKRMVSMKKIYVENNLFDDYNNKLGFLTADTFKNDTNIPNLSFLSTIPIMSPIFCERVAEIIKKKNSEKISFDKSKDIPRMTQIDLNLSDDPKHRYFRWKLLMKLSVFYFFFSYMMKGNFYQQLLFFVLFIYYKYIFIVFFMIS